MNKAKSIIKEKHMTFVIALLLTVLASTMWIQAPDQATVSRSVLTLGSEKTVITLGHEAYAAGDVDYTFGATNADVQFQAALDALPATGGRLVCVSAVQVNWTALTTVTRAIPNVIIEGSGRGTSFVGDGVTPIFTVGGDGWEFKDIAVDAGGIAMGATTGWMWTSVLDNATYYAYRSPYGQSIFNDVTVASLTDSGLTDTRVPIAGVGGLLSDDADLTYDTATDILETPTGRGATLVVAASDADAQSKAQADYVCDGTADQVEIHAAQTALPAGGGSIKLTEGTFTTSGVLTLNKDNVSLLGSRGTVLDVDFSGGAFNSMINVSASHLEIAGIAFKPTYTLVENPTRGITGPITDKYVDVSIHNCLFESVPLTTKATISKGIEGNYAWNWRVYDNHFIGCSWEGISFGSGIVGSAYYPNECVITGNTVEGTDFTGDFGNYGGIVVEAGAMNCIISNNTIRDVSETAGDGYGIYVGGFAGDLCNNNIIIGNTISGIQLFGIYLYGNENIISNNIITAAQIGIGISADVDRTTISGNCIYRTSDGINDTDGARNVTIIGNTIESCAGVGIDIEGDNCIIKNNTISYIAAHAIYYRATASGGIVENNSISNYGTGGVGQIGVIGISDTEVLSNRFFDDQPSDTTTLDGDAASGQKDIVVADASSFAVQEAITTNPTGFGAENHIISAIDYYSNTITTSVNLTNNHTNGDPVVGRKTSKYVTWTSDRAENNIVDWESLVYTENYIYTDVDVVRNNRGCPSVLDLRDSLSAVLAQMGDEVRVLLPCVEQTGMTVSDYSSADADFAPVLNLNSWNIRYKYVGDATYYTIDTGETRYLIRADDPNFTFGNGAADTAVSWFALVNLVDATDSTIMAKYRPADNREWKFHIDSNDYLTIETFDDDAAASIGCEHQTAFTEDTWKFVVATYDGSSTDAGFNLYIDGAKVADVDVGAGAYTAMEDKGREITVGVQSNWTNYLDGSFTWVGITAKELSANDVNVMWHKLAELIAE